jgi:hypothetical protein
MLGLQPHATQQGLQHGADLALQCQPGRGGLNATHQPLEQRQLEPVFQRTNLLAHRALRHAQLGGSLGKAAIAQHRLKMNQAFQRWQVLQIAAHMLASSS